VQALQSANLDNFAGPHYALGRAITEVAHAPSVSSVSVAGIDFSPAFHKRVTVRKNSITTCFWVFNGLNTVEALDERHWKRLQKCGYLPT
jgi:hypothetical protein